ncbi:MAG: hypothetical protein ACRC8S_00870 [Fimbriiglobus sp.]
MVSISLAMSAAVGFLAAAIPTPDFAPSYAKALSRASQEQKPVAVFIGQGNEGLQKLVTAGELSTEAAKALKTQYVCVYVDSTTEAGKELAGSFQMNEGLVISDKTGQLQALRHEGFLPAASLSQYTISYAQPTAPVTQTVYGQRIINGFENRPILNAVTTVFEQRPVLNTMTNVRDFVFPNAPGIILPSRSSCPNGRCPNAR